MLGPVDTGKSTICNALYRHWLGKGSAGYLDGDCGQASFGAPATVALSEQAAEHAPSQQLERFVGATSPAGHLLPALTGIRRLKDAAESQRTVIDSSGFVEGPVAVEFQINVIDCIRPTVVIGLGRSAAVATILRTFRYERAMHTVGLPVSPEVKTKTPEFRREYRKRRFAAYFAPAALKRISLQRVGVYGQIPNFLRAPSYTNRLCALCGAGQFVHALALALEYHPAERLLTVLTPATSLENVISIQFGSLFLTPEGDER